VMLLLLFLWEILPKFEQTEAGMYKLLIRRILFILPPETAHKIVVMLLKLPFMSRIMGFFYCLDHPLLSRNICGLSFKNCVGLAAGFDKDAQYYNQMADLGFGFIEIGTVTPKAQAGNEQPRLFRLIQDSALLNRMGFNNRGVAYAVDQLKKKRRKNLVIGGNIGKNKQTSNANAVEDYVTCFEALYNYVDYIAVNVSSPNTPNLRALQDKEPLMAILSALQAANNQKVKRKPILLKIAPDLNQTQLDDILEIVRLTGIDGIIATNTTISRDNLQTNSYKIAELGAGGVSGLPLRSRSTEIIRYLVQKSQGKIPVIGVGGIHSAEDALEKLRAGASLIQLYTGFIYEGAGLIKRINKACIKNQL
jgi:dihydroorotate dehydrogenase